MDPHPSVVSTNHVRPSLRAGETGEGQRKPWGWRPHSPVSTSVDYTPISTTRGGVVFADLHGTFVVGVTIKRQEGAGSEDERTVFQGRIIRGSLEVSSQLHDGNLLW